MPIIPQNSMYGLEKISMLFCIFLPILPILTAEILMTGGNL